MLRERLESEKKEFLCRLGSSFLFILIVILLFWVPLRVFSFFCWGTYAILLYEIFSQKIEGKIPLRLGASALCFAGVLSFIHCRERLGLSGCVFLICMSSFTDIGAYSFGKILRGPKLCPKISPQKTWAGFWGGIFFANITFFCLRSTFFQFSPKTPFGSENVVNLGTLQLVILASVGGDLLESWFKRKMKVKDMGDLFPGHGGFLDRLDSLLLASIVLATMEILYRSSICSIT